MTPCSMASTTMRPPPLSRRRPKRQRKSTTLYTDDNPSTFTTKKKKGEYAEPDDSPPPPEKPTKPSSYFFVEESLPMKRPYRRKKPTEKAAAAAAAATPGFSPRVVSNEVSTVPLVGFPGSPDPNAPPVKRKRGRPPSKKTLMERQIAAQRAAAAESAAAATTAAQQEPEPPKPIDPTPAAPVAPVPAPAAAPPTTTRISSSSKATSICSISWTPPLHDALGSFIPHAVSVAPILPPTQHDKNPRHISEQKYPAVFGNGLGVTAPLDEPKWNPLHTPDVYFEDDYESDENRRLDASVLPVTRSITCVTTRKPDNQYMAVGDTAGFCIIYSMGTHIRPIARLETVACQQRAREEQEKIREQKQRKKGKQRSLVMDTSQTTIHALGMIGTRVVLATACELECMDVPSQTSLWVCPLTSNRLVTSLDMHMSTYDVLVSCSLYQQTLSDLPHNAATPLATSPLMLLQHSENNVEICDANSPILLKSPCCTAMWDASTTAESRLLFVAVSDTENELELVLVQGGSIDSWKVACKTKIPVKSSNHQTRLCQSPKGLYTLVASSRGIRLYQTETLQLIHVYGDNLALHGKSVVWQDCLLLGKQNGLPKPDKATNKNLEYRDWLQSQENETEKGQDESEESELGLYVIGVPNFKGPKELCETLHVWRTEQATTVPALSIPLPPKSEGVQGLVPAPPTLGGDRIVLSTRSGHGHILLPRVKSNFAGIMYPAGYNIIDDNLDFIEDEDELDDVEVDRKAPEEETEEDDDVDVLIPEGEEMDEDLKEALRQSLLEQKRQKARESVKDSNVDILGHVTVADENDELLIPCRPEAYLKQAVNSCNDFGEVDRDTEEDQETQQEILGEQPSELSNMGPLFVSNILENMPNRHKKKAAASNELGFTVTAKIAVVTNPIPNRQGRGKRSRASNLETILKSSIDPHLQRFMISKQGVCSDGSGSRLVECSKDAADEPTRNAEIADALNPAPITPSTPTSNSVDMVIVREEGAVILCAKTGQVGNEFIGDKTTNKVTSAELHKNSNGYVGGKGEASLPKSDAARALSVRPDEAAVALGLLGLSPCHNNSASESGGSIGPAENFQPPLLAGGATDDSTGGSSDASVERPSLSPKATGSTTHLLNHVVYRTTDSSIGDTSDRASTVADTISEIASSHHASKQKIINCYACRGRQVIHTCGKRSLPIDFDEVAKAEREKKMKEEEEKKKLRAEKRRQADARRREAKKQKQLEMEERRRREEEQLQLERERQRRAAAENTKTSILQHTDPDQKRREMIVASYVDYTSSHPNTQWPTQEQPQVAMTSVDYNRQAETVTEYSAKPVAAENPPPAAFKYQGCAKPPSAETPRHGFTQPQLSLNGRTSSLGTLSSADALVALANLSTAAAAPPVQEPPKQPETQSYSYVSTSTVRHTASHGFGTGLTTSTSETSRSVIPSYAAIRSQGTNGLSNSFISYNKEANTNGSTAYSWQRAAPAVNRATEYYTEKYYNPSTGKEYTAEEKARLRTG